MHVLMKISDWADLCGYFLNSVYENDAITHFGDNCWHPENDPLKKGVGNCYSWSCPFGYEANEEDCINFGLEYKEAAYIIVDIPEEDYREDCMEVRKNVPQTENTAQIKIEIFVKSNEGFQNFKNAIKDGLDETLAIVSNNEIQYELSAEDNSLYMYESEINDDGEYITVDKNNVFDFLEDIEELEAFTGKLIKLFL